MIRDDAKDIDRGGEGKVAKVTPGDAGGNVEAMAMKDVAGVDLWGHDMGGDAVLVRAFPDCENFWMRAGQFGRAGMDVDGFDVERGQKFGGHDHIRKKGDQPGFGAKGGEGLVQGIRGVRLSDGEVGVFGQEVVPQMGSHFGIGQQQDGAGHVDLKHFGSVCR